MLQFNLKLKEKLNLIKKIDDDNDDDNDDIDFSISQQLNDYFIESYHLKL